MHGRTDTHQNMRVLQHARALSKNVFSPKQQKASFARTINSTPVCLVRPILVASNPVRFLERTPATSNSNAYCRADYQTSSGYPQNVPEKLVRDEEEGVRRDLVQQSRGGTLHERLGKEYSRHRRNLSG